MSDYPGIREMLKAHEGSVAYAYTDSLGYLTIGVGHLIDKRKGGSLPPSIIDALLDYDIQAKRDELDKVLPWASSLDQVRHDVLVDMAFNMGTEDLLGFQRMLMLLKSGQYADAATAMVQSKWSGQVGKRAVQLAKMLESGEWSAT